MPDGFLFTAVLLIFFYFLFLIGGNLFLVFQKEPDDPEPEKQAFFLCLIPAKNEERVIGNCIRSLQAQNYPKDRYAVCVIANGCTDRTARIARDLGVTVMEPQEMIRNKGEALRCAFREWKGRAETDACLIMDADTLADADLLKYMNHAYQKGYDAAQAQRTGSNRTYSSLTRICEMYYVIQNSTYNRRSLTSRGNTSYNGTGWMIRKSFLDRTGFDTVTITEDVEYMALTALVRGRSVYVPKAVVYSEYAADLNEAYHQKTRWFRGQYMCLKTYGGRLMKQAFASRDRECLSVLMLYSSYLALLAFPPVFLAVILRTIRYGFGKMALGVLLLYVLAVLFCMTVSVRSVSGWRENIAGSFLFPFALFTWYPEIFMALFSRDRWISQTHGMRTQYKP